MNWFDLYFPILFWLNKHKIQFPDWVICSFRSYLNGDKTQKGLYKKSPDFFFNIQKRLKIFDLT